MPKQKTIIPTETQNGIIADRINGMSEIKLCEKYHLGLAVMRRFLRENPQIDKTKQEAIINKFRSKNEELLDSVKSEDIEKMTPMQKFIAAGICADKTKALTEKNKVNEERPPVIQIIINKGDTVGTRQLENQGETVLPVLCSAENTAVQS